VPALAPGCPRLSPGVQGRRPDADRPVAATGASSLAAGLSRSTDVPQLASAASEDPGGVSVPTASSSVVALAFADEIVGDPTLLAQYARTVRAAHPVTLLVYAPDTDPDDLGRRLEPIASAYGLDGDDGAEVVGLAVPGDAETRAEILRSVDCLLSRRPAPDAFSSLDVVAPENAAMLLDPSRSWQRSGGGATPPVADLEAPPAGDAAERMLAGWRSSPTVAGPDIHMPERAYPGMPHSGVMREHALRYAFALDLVAGREALDLGCGTGYGSEMLTWTARSVTGFDLWQPGDAERPSWGGGARLVYGHDLCADPLPAAEVAVMYEVLEHLADPVPALERLWSAVDTAVVSFPSPFYHGSHHNPYHLNDWPLDRVEREVREAGEQRFERVDLEHFHQPADGLIRPGRDPEAPYWIVVARGVRRRPARVEDDATAVAIEPAARASGSPLLLASPTRRPPTVDVSSGTTTIEHLAATASGFALTLAQAKEASAPREFWYPYGSLSNLTHLDRLLTGENRMLLRLADGLPVADIGAADGDLAFLVASLGYDVDIVDNGPTNFNGLEGARRLRDVLRLPVGIHEVDLDRQFALPRDEYGLVFFLGLLYHLQNPYYALRTLSEHAHHCLVSTRIAQESPDGDTRLDHLPVAYLLAPDEANDDATNYWIFSDAGLRRIVDRAGWDVLDYVRVGCLERSNPADADRDERAFCLLRSRRLS
jgi:tRNA (mo5U34)-methyltransferase